MRIAPLVLLLAAAPPATDDAPPPGRVAGPARQCIALRPDTDSEIQRGRILYKPNGRTWYANTPDNCAILKPDRAVATMTPTTSLCRGDIIRVFDPRSPIVYGSCGLGDFVPYTRAAH